MVAFAKGRKPKRKVKKKESKVLEVKMTPYSSPQYQFQHRGQKYVMDTLRSVRSMTDRLGYDAFRVKSQEWN
jgi:hypothetical protein